MGIKNFIFFNEGWTFAKIFDDIILAVFKKMNMQKGTGKMPKKDSGRILKNEAYLSFRFRWANIAQNINGLN